MSGGPLRGPLPLIVIAAALFIAYKYIPFDTLLERFQKGSGVATVENPSLSTPAADSPTTADQGTPAPPLVPVPQAAPLGESAAQPAPAAVVITEEPKQEAAAPARPEQKTVPARAVEVQPEPIAEAVKPEPAKPPKVESPKRKVTAESTRVSPASPEAKPVATAAKPAPPPTAPPAPGLHVFVAADVDYRAGLDAYSAERYSSMLRQEMLAAAEAYLGSEVMADDAGNRSFRDHLADGSDGIERLCQQIDGGRLLLADLTIPTAGFSTIESAYWPEVELKAINCNGNRLHRKPRQRLEPHYRDRFPYQFRFTEMAEQFVASQAYFLKP